MVVYHDYHIKATNDEKHGYGTSRYYFTLEGFHMGHRQAENGKFVWFASERATCWYHVTQLIYIGGHLATSTPFNLTMALPILKMKTMAQKAISN